jgi:hypothetical protein
MPAHERAAAMATNSPVAFARMKASIGDGLDATQGEAWQTGIAAQSERLKR